MFFRQFLLFIIFFQFSNAIFAQDDIESDILFQKIQELEIEIANLRNELESCMTVQLELLITVLDSYCI